MLVRMPIEHDTDYAYIEVWIEDSLLCIKKIPKPCSTVSHSTVCLGELEFCRLRQAVEFVEELDG